MDLSKPPFEINEAVLRSSADLLEASVLAYCETLEVAINKVKAILEDQNLNDALLDIYDPEREPASEDICKAFLAIKQVLAKVV